jgi:predicted GH43/DUF377 family glycosyl hydrolase
MKSKLSSLLLAGVAVISLQNACVNPSAKTETASEKMEYDWMLGPFVKKPDANPCLKPDKNASFFDPIRKEEVHWQNVNAYNPAAIVKDGKVYLLFRAEDDFGEANTSMINGTSRIGLAISEDGYNFVCKPEPVLYPDNDEFQSLEWEGGCEDPRVIESRDGRYFLYYTSYNGKTALLCCAESADLEHWTKHGPIFGKTLNGKYAGLWSKSGSVVCKQDGEHFYPVKIREKYWMYWGESNIYAATSDDLVNWTPVEYIADGSDPARSRRIVDNRVPANSTDSEKVLMPVITPRTDDFDGYLCEPGPQALLTDAGIVLIYNGKGNNPDRDGIFYSGGQLLLDPQNPVCVIMRTVKPFIAPTESYDIWRWSSNKKSGNVFLENLVYFKGKYMMYYGAADHEVAIAETENKIR